MKSISTLRAMSVCFLATMASLTLGCGDGQMPGGEGLQGEVEVDGSSTVGPISKAMAEAFVEVEPKVRVTVGISGTGGGFKRFVKGEIDISDASRPIKPSELEAAQQAGVEFIEIPVAYDGLTIVVNPSNTWVEKLTVADLKKIFLESQAAETWRDVNPNWPAEPIKIYSPGTDSGTFDYFKEVVVDEGEAIRADMSVSEDDNVLVKGVVGEKGAIGFFGAAYYFENEQKLRAVPIVNDAGDAVLPNDETIGSGEYNPFSRPVFIYVSKKSAERPEVEAFVNFYLDKENIREIVSKVGYVPLPEAIYDKARENFANRETGTDFVKDGEKVSGSLATVYE